MNKQSISKLALFLTGLKSRIQENDQYFKKLTAVFKSGTKEFTANILLENKRLKVNYSGNTETIELDQLGEKLTGISEKYESVAIVYEERGSTIYIEGDNKNVKMRTKETTVEEAVQPHNETSTIGNRDYVIKVGQADDLLREIGILGANGKVRNDRVRKYNQIDHFVELISDLLKDLTEKHESITVMDCGCGKSYLSFVLNYYIKEVLKKSCQFIGIDYSSPVIDASRKIAQRLGYHNMEFKQTEIGAYEPNRDIHLVISLHACDTATDQAIAFAVNHHVETMVMVPCCQRELLSQYTYEPFKEIVKHGILKARMADVLTDGMRALLLEALGYKVSVVEYISPLETPKNLMLRAEKTSAGNKRAQEEYRKLKKLLGVSLTMEKLIFDQFS